MRDTPVTAFGLKPLLRASRSPGPPRERTRFFAKSTLFAQLRPPEKICAKGTHKAHSRSLTPHARDTKRRDCSTHVDEGDRDRGRERGVVVASLPGGARGDEEVLGLCAERVGDAEGFVCGQGRHAAAREQERLVDRSHAEQRRPQRLNRRIRTSHTVEQELEVSGQHRVLRRVGHDYAQRVVAVMTDL